MNGDGRDVVDLIKAALQAIAKLQEAISEVLVQVVERQAEFDRLSNSMEPRRGRPPMTWEQKAAAAAERERKRAETGPSLQQTMRELDAKIQQETERQETERREKRKQPNRTDGQIPPLSQRQREVADLMVRGVGSPEIATRLKIAPSTVREHRKVLFKKVGVRTVKQLISKLEASAHESQS